MKKKILKGFTLIELIVVMAIFSILMAGALALVDPVSKINKTASDFEKTNAYVDNIQDYLQDSLRYAENVWVYQGNMSDSDLKDEAEDFRNKYYNETITTKDGSDVVYTKGNIRILTILNNDMPDGSGGIQNDSNGTPMCKGQILLNKFEYKSDSSIASIGISETQLNPTFFTKDFDFAYLLGASQLVNSGRTNIPDGTAIVEKISDGSGINYQNFSIGIVTYDKKEYEKDNKILQELEPPETLNPGEYPFTCQYTVATIPLINIINRHGLPKEYYVYGQKDDGSGIDENKIEEKYDPASTPPSFPSLTSSKLDGNPRVSGNSGDNIYIIYSLTDEVNKPQ